MVLEIINPPIDIWSNYSDTAYPALITYGYDVYALIVDPTDKTQWRYVVLNNGESQVIDIPTGYEYSHTIEPKAGFSATGNKVRQPSGDVNIFTVTKKYPALDVFYGATENDPLWVDFDTLAAIDITGIPEDEFSIVVEGYLIKDMAININF